MNTIILKRYDGETFTFELFNIGDKNARDWISRKSVKEIESVDEELFEIYNDISLPIVMGFVDLGLNSSHPNGTLTLRAGKTQTYKTLNDRHQAI